MDFIEIYTDGACDPNPGAGGWGAHMRYLGNIKEFCGGEVETTNNRMEMMGAIEALERLQAPSAVIVYSDSQYLVKGMTQWMKGWKKKNWMRGQNEPVKNVDLWKRLDALSEKHSVKWVWVKGHAGNEGNERADALASVGRMKALGLKTDFNNAQAWGGL